MSSETLGRFSTPTRSALMSILNGRFRNEISAGTGGSSHTIRCRVKRSWALQGCNPTRDSQVRRENVARRRPKRQGFGRLVSSGNHSFACHALSCLVKGSALSELSMRSSAERHETLNQAEGFSRRRWAAAIRAICSSPSATALPKAAGWPPGNGGQSGRAHGCATAAFPSPASRLHSLRASLSFDLIAKCPSWRRSCNGPCLPATDGGSPHSRERHPLSLTGERQRHLSIIFGVS